MTMAESQNSQCPRVDWHGQCISSWWHCAEQSLPICMIIEKRPRSAMTVQLETMDA